MESPQSRVAVEPSRQVISPNTVYSFEDHSTGLKISK
jgi:hypothetical protein